MISAQYIIGIDLGTTNCTLSYAPLDGSAESSEIKQLLIGQTVSEGQWADSFMLPSSIYFPLPKESEQSYFIGQYAKDRGAQVQGRLIASSKSWLVVPNIGERGDFLPLHSLDDTLKMSPLKAISACLNHLKEAWNEKMADAPFHEQEVTITVPASFDPQAKEMVVQAAKDAQFGPVVLLEEPLAAFYSWLSRHQENWRQLLQVGETILVIDIGGGTSDFSLIEVTERGGSLALERRLVGRHLLLGGDNLDLALAQLACSKLEEKQILLDDWQQQQMTYACCNAKERFLGEESPESLKVTIQGRGSRLIGGSLSVTFTKAEVLGLIVDGFLPLTPSTLQVQPEKMSGLQKLSLPYVQDPRLSCHLAKFLSQSGEGEIQSSQHDFIIPTHVLFNGGTMKAASLRQRALALLRSWALERDQAEPKELSDPDYDFAVSTGAAYFGLVCKGNGIRVRAGTSSAYFIGVDSPRPAIPGFPPPLDAICVVPFGMEEGSEVELPQKEFVLLLGEMALFRFFSRSTPDLPGGQVINVGDVVRQWQTLLTELHPIEASLSQQIGQERTVSVRLKAKVTETGMLELYCVALDGRQWKLEFNLRSNQVLAMAL